MSGDRPKIPEERVTGGLSGRKQAQTRGVGDFFGPFFRVQFLAATREAGQQLNGDATFSEQKSLVPASTTREGDEKLTDIFELDSRLLPKVGASLKMESNAGSPLKFTLTLTPTYEDGMRILNNRLLTFGTLVRVQWGYTSWAAHNNILSDVFVFRNNYPEADFGDDIRIVLSGHDLVSSVGMRNMTRKQWDFGTYTNDCKIVEELVKPTGMSLKLDDVPPESSFLTGSNRKPNQKAVGQVTNDWSFIRSLVAAHSLSCDVTGDQLRIYSLYNFSKAIKEPAYRFLWRKAPVTNKDIPVSKVKGNLQPYLFLPPQGRGLVDFTFNPDTMETTAKEIDGTNVDPTDSPLGDKPADGSPDGTPPTTLASSLGDTGEAVITEEGVSYVPRPRREPGSGAMGAAVSQPIDSHNREEKVNQIVRKAQALSHPKVGISALGVVDVWPGVLCRLEGTSLLFDGSYTVLKASHSISNGGYDMELELMRHTVRGDGPTPSGTVTEVKTEPASSQNGLTGQGPDVPPTLGEPLPEGA